jgi:tRNA A37 methylthiotransferase MiaB
VEDASKIILLGCGVVQEFEDNSVDMVTDCLQKRASAEVPVYVAGCISNIAKSRLEELQTEGLNCHVVDKFDKLKEHFPSDFGLYDGNYGDKNHKIGATPRRRTLETGHKAAARDRIREMDKVFGTGMAYYFEYLTNVPYEDEAQDMYNVIISRGCAYRCAYCVIVNGRGYEYKSRTKEDIRQEFVRGREQGYRRFHLIAEENGKYGIDLKDDPTDLVDLMNYIIEAEQPGSEPKAQFAIKYLFPADFVPSSRA